MDNRSFGGRNVQVPVAVDILSGKDYETVGVKIEEKELKHIELREGTIVHIDNFGIMKLFKIKNDNFNKDKLLDVYINGCFAVTAKYSEKMKTCEDGEWIIFNGSSLNPPLLEIALVRSENSAKELNAKIGDVVTIVQHGGELQDGI